MTSGGVGPTRPSGGRAPTETLRGKDTYTTLVEGKTKGETRGRRVVDGFKLSPQRTGVGGQPVTENP